MCDKEKFILYVDDDADDREMLTEAIHKADPMVKVRLAENGLQALHVLHEVKKTRLPCLIVLDLNMPFLDGKEVFQRLKNDEELDGVPVLIFSSSEKPDDKAGFNSMGIEYFSKPSHFSHLEQIASHMVSICCKA